MTCRTECGMVVGVSLYWRKAMIQNSDQTPHWLKKASSVLDDFFTTSTVGLTCVLIACATILVSPVLIPCWAVGWVVKRTFGPLGPMKGAS